MTVLSMLAAAVAIGLSTLLIATPLGDALGVVVANCPETVSAWLAAAGLSGDEALRKALLAERDITTLSAATVERFVKATGHTQAQTLIDSGEAKAWIEGRHLIDLIQSFPATVTAEHLTTITRPLPPRAYSIASSRKEVGDEVHLAIAAVRYETHGRARPGATTTDVPPGRRTRMETASVR